MESNNIVAAPQITGLSALFAVWKESHFGDFASFLKFLAAPSVQRDEFMAPYRAAASLMTYGSVAVQNISVK